MSTATATPLPLLRTLAPALRELEQGTDGWLNAPRTYPQAESIRTALAGLARDLGKQADALDVNRPLLVIMLMGGTGVGKSTLLNALAGESIAQASFVRPTTKDPVVYYHESMKPEQLDPALQRCRLAPHNRESLEQKILVDTPDLDSNDLSNREKLEQLLTIADVVLYVGSQEKYHDKLGWDLFLQHRQRRAFAFVLNKWDRCLHLESGIRPDDDLLRDLKSEGFENPLIFRTCAQIWVDRAKGGPNGATLPNGEQFQDLIHWLEMGLSRLEIEAIKARGVIQLLQQLQHGLEEARPPDLGEVAQKTRDAWRKVLADEASATVDVLLNTLEPYQHEIEHHFTREGQRRFRGMMAVYLRLFTRTRYIGSTIRDRIPFLPKPADKAEAPSSLDLATFTSSCSTIAGDKHLDARSRALPNRLLVEADQQGFPIQLLAEPTEATTRLDWHKEYGGLLAEILQDVQKGWAQPTGVRRWIQVIIIYLAEWLPLIAFLAACIRLLWLYFMAKDVKIEWTDVLIPFIVLLFVLVIFHILIVIFLPLHWSNIRGEFEKRLRKRVEEELDRIYATIPIDTAAKLHHERCQADQLLGRVKEVHDWLERREQAASIAGLYGSTVPLSEVQRAR